MQGAMNDRGSDLKIFWPEFEFFQVAEGSESYLRGGEMLAGESGKIVACDGIYLFECLLDRDLAAVNHFGLSECRCPGGRVF